jgi:Glycosyl hydrolases family 39
MRRWLPLIFALLILALPAAARATTYGAEVGGDFVNQVRGVWSATQASISLDGLYAAGGRVGRADSDWANAEPKAPAGGRHVYDWAYDDMIVGGMAQARLRWQPDLEFAPKWAEVHESDVLHLSTGRFVVPLPPASNATFGAYAAAFMRRYGPGGSFWTAHATLPYLPVTTLEVWNEPDNKHFWGADINLQHYAAMYEVVRAAIHRVDPHAQVVTGGLAWTTSSLPRLLRAFRHMPVDAVAFHPYAATPHASIALANYAIAEMRSYGRARTPLLANEYGWTSDRDSWGSTQARNVSRYSYQTLIGLAKLHLADILPFEWTDRSWGLSDGTYARALRVILSGR